MALTVAASRETCVCNLAVGLHRSFFDRTPESTARQMTGELTTRHLNILTAFRSAHISSELQFPLERFFPEFPQSRRGERRPIISRQTGSLPANDESVRRSASPYPPKTPCSRFWEFAVGRPPPEERRRRHAIRRACACAHRRDRLRRSRHRRPGDRGRRAPLADPS
jgi:hypothetical protein